MVTVGRQPENELVRKISVSKPKTKLEQPANSFNVGPMFKMPQKQFNVRVTLVLNAPVCLLWAVIFTKPPAEFTNANRGRGNRQVYV